MTTSTARDFGSPADWIAGASKTVSLLDVEPEFGHGIDAEDWELARQATRTTLIRINRRECALLPRAGDTCDVIGLVVKDGMISREIALGEHVAFELLVPGDPLLFPAAGRDDLDLGGAILTALNPTELIVLGRRFIHAAARWPSLLTNLHRRLEFQRQRLAIQGLAAHLPRAEDRVLLTLWILANSCGHVTPDGIVLPLAISHEALGRLAAARRPTVTLALRGLEAADCVHRRPSGHLSLGSAAQQRVHELIHGSIPGPPLGASVALDLPTPASGLTAVPSASRNGRSAGV